MATMHALQISSEMSVKRLVVSPCRFAATVNCNDFCAVKNTLFSRVQKSVQIVPYYIVGSTEVP